jgi:hypothetical protein
LIDEVVEDEDIILLDTGRAGGATAAKKNRTVRLIEGILKTNTSMAIAASLKRFEEPVQLGMQVLALKDRDKHKWKLARISRIINKQSEQNGEIPYASYVASSQYRVVFDDEDNSDTELAVPFAAATAVAPAALPPTAEANNRKLSKYLFYFNPIFIYPKTWLVSLKKLAFFRPSTKKMVWPWVTIRFGQLFY